MPNVLIVENDRDLRTRLHRYLAVSGYRVLTAEGGREALRVIGERHVNLVITTLVMEEFDGIELIQNLHTQQPRIKIIAISGGGLVPPTAYLDAALMLGAHACFAKPLSIPDVLQAVRQLMSPLPSFLPESRQVESSRVPA